MTEFWSVWIIVLTLGTLLICAALIGWDVKQMEEEIANGQRSPDDFYDWGEVTAYDRPIPYGWLYSFYLCVFFALAYFFFYPALGRLPGVLHWTSESQYAQESTKHQAQYAESLNRYAQMSVPEIARNPEARHIGHQVFLLYCQNCHQAGGLGTLHYPNLTDQDWLWGGSPEKIEETISQGRTGVMPAWGALLGDRGVEEVTEYVVALSGRFPTDPKKVGAGRAKFEEYCSFCHAMNGAGDTRLGVPNLTDDIWLHIDLETVANVSLLETHLKRIISKGLNNLMPAHWEMVDKVKIRLLAGYVYSLSD
ncbi:Cbb3-type cytochrome c oxidase subunit [Gammaproteobacteria bacterium]